MWPFCHSGRALSGQMSPHRRDLRRAHGSSLLLALFWRMSLPHEALTSNNQRDISSAQISIGGQEQTLSSCFTVVTKRVRVISHLVRNYQCHLFFGSCLKLLGNSCRISRPIMPHGFLVQVLLLHVNDTLRNQGWGLSGQQNAHLSGESLKICQDLSRLMPP